MVFLYPRSTISGLAEEAKIHLPSAIGRPPPSAVQPSRERRRGPSASKPRAEHYTPNTRSPALAASYWYNIVCQTSLAVTRFFLLLPVGSRKRAIGC